MHMLIQHAATVKAVHACEFDSQSSLVGHAVVASVFDYSYSRCNVRETPFYWSWVSSETNDQHDMVSCTCQLQYE